MVIYEVTASNLDNAKIKALQKGLEVTRNVTKEWKDAGSPLTPKALRDFAIEKYQNYDFEYSLGSAAIIIVEDSIENTRVKPWIYKNNAMPGRRSIFRVFEIRLKSTDDLIGEAHDKKEAIRKAKTLMLHYKEDMYCKIVYRVAEKEMETVFYLNYAPSASTKDGTYIIFGNKKM